MTKPERTQLRKAIQMVMDDDGDFSGGIDILCRLAGLTYPAEKIRWESRLVSLAELASRPNQAFKVGP